MTTLALDPVKVREDFPLLATLVNGRPVAYLDNGATSQKPRAVLEALDRYWREQNANVHRGVHQLGERATGEFERARENARHFLNSQTGNQVIFTHGLTESLNAVASGLSSDAGASRTDEPGTAWISRGDWILVSEMEHHSNIVPWQIAAARADAKVHPIPITDAGEIDLDAYQGLLDSGPVKVVAITHVSNVLGTVNPIKEMAAAAHRAGALIVVDGAQAGPHLRIDVQDLDADFYALSCHKMYAPTGIGVLYGKRELLEALPPFQAGGSMIRKVTLTEGTSYAPLPAKHEAGTPNIAGAVGVGAAIRYLDELVGPLEATFAWIQDCERSLAKYATERLLDVPGLTIHGSARDKAGIISFTMDCAHPHDIGTVLDGEGVAVRAGHHCCQPLMQRLGVPATVRASIAFYNTREDVDRLINGVRKVQEIFA